MKRYNIVLMIILLVIIVSACSQAKDNPIYKNEDYGFTMEFPKSWSEEFEIEPYDYGLIISSKVNEIETLGYIHKYTTDEWKNSNYGLDIPLEFQILGEDEKSVVIIIYPSDVNYNLDNQDSVKRNQEMIKDLKDEKAIFTFVD